MLIVWEKLYLLFSYCYVNIRADGLSCYAILYSSEWTLSPFKITHELTVDGKAPSANLLLKTGVIINCKVQYVETYASEGMNHMATSVPEDTLLVQIYSNQKSALNFFILLLTDQIARALLWWV